MSERRGMTFDNAPLDQQGNIGAGVMSREMVYNYPQSGGSYSDMPTYTQMTEDWAGRSTASTPVTNFSVADNPSGLTRTTTITRPDGAQIVQVVNTSPGSLWLYGLSGWTRLYRDGALLRQSKMYWDGGGIVGFDIPRLIRAEITDERGRMTVTRYSYDPAYGGSRYNAPTDVRLYGYGDTDTAANYCGACILST